jgi:hypothetical protein
LPTRRPLEDAALHGRGASAADHSQSGDIDKDPVIRLYGVEMGRLMVVVIDHDPDSVDDGDGRHFVPR